MVLVFGVFCYKGHTVIFGCSCEELFYMLARQSINFLCSSISLFVQYSQRWPRKPSFVPSCRWVILMVNIPLYICLSPEYLAVAEKNDFLCFVEAYISMVATSIVQVSFQLLVREIGLHCFVVSSKFPIVDIFFISLDGVYIVYFPVMTLACLFSLYDYVMFKYAQ